MPRSPRRDLAGVAQSVIQRGKYYSDPCFGALWWRNDPTSTA